MTNEERGVRPIPTGPVSLLEVESGHTHAQGADQMGMGGGHGVSSPGEASGGTSLGSQPPLGTVSVCGSTRPSGLWLLEGRVPHPHPTSRSVPPQTRPRQTALPHPKDQHKVLGKLGGQTRTPRQIHRQTDRRRLAGACSLPPHTAPHHPCGHYCVPLSAAAL